MHPVSISSAHISKNHTGDIPKPVVPDGAVCLFAAYCPTGDLPPYTRFYLKNLMLCGFTLHIIVSGAPIITEQTRNFCTQYGIHFWCRENGGLDFGAWQYLINQDVTQNAPLILLANDSVFGPFSPLPSLLQKLQIHNAPAWGLVASRAITPHIQSWFIGFAGDVWQSPTLQRVFRQPFADMSREEIIWHGELGLSVALKSLGIPLHTLWSDVESPVARLFPANPMHVFWRQMLVTGKVPFLKQELLRDNPYHIRHLDEWERLISTQNDFNPNWIKSYLSQTSARNRVHSSWKGRALYNALSTIDRYRF